MVSANFQMDFAFAGGEYFDCFDCHVPYRRIGGGYTGWRPPDLVTEFASKIAPINQERGHSMRFPNRTVLLAALCLELGFLIGKVWDSSSAYAQTGAPVSPVRFQISAYPGVDARNAQHGAYIIDTMTGKIWRVVELGLPQQVVGKLQ